MPFRFYTGSYASTGEEGVARYQIDFEQGRWEKEAACSLLDKPAYLLLDSARQLLYCAEECLPDGRLSVLSLSGNGFSLQRSLLTGGVNPCHIHRYKERLYIANYITGSLAVFPLDAQGLIEEPFLMQHTGRGPHPVRQIRAHAHFSQVQNGVLYVCDLGLDKVFRYLPEPEDRKLPSAGEPVPLPPGTGPRHLCFHPLHPEWMYVLCELSSQVCFFRLSGGEWQLLQQISMLPEGFAGESTAAAIRMTADGGYLFGSNRGDDSIALFSVGEDGRLLLRDICKTGGKTPRDFMLFGSYLVIANQDSDLLSVLRFDPSGGRLVDTGMRMPSVKPTCVCPA